MGLLFQFPENMDEKNYVIQQDQKVRLRSYGLPSLFWLYGLLCFICLTLLTWSTQTSVSKILQFENFWDQALGYGLIFLLAAAYLLLISFFYFEINLILIWNPNLNELRLKKEYRIFGIPIYWQTQLMTSEHSFRIHHFLDTPNYARLQNNPELRSFQNSGYFEFWSLDHSDPSHKKMLLDRSSRKNDLEKLQKLLEHFIQTFKTRT